MALRKLKIGIGLLFLIVFITKMGVSFVPVFLSAQQHTKVSDLNPSEQDTKGDAKDNSDKDDNKDKLADIDLELPHAYAYTPVLTAANFFYHHQQLLYHQSHYPAVLLPPPNRA